MGTSGLGVSTPGTSGPPSFSGVASLVLRQTPPWRSHLWLALQWLSSVHAWHWANTQWGVGALQSSLERHTGVLQAGVNHTLNRPRQASQTRCLAWTRDRRRCADEGGAWWLSCMGFLVFDWSWEPGVSLALFSIVQVESIFGYGTSALYGDSLALLLVSFVAFVTGRTSRRGSQAVQGRSG